MSVSFTVGTALGGAAGWGAVSTSLTLFAGRNIIVAISKDNTNTGTLTVDGGAATQLAAGQGVYFYEVERESAGSASIGFSVGGGVNSWGMVPIGVAGAGEGIDDSFSGSASTDGSGSGTVASGLDVPSGGAGLFVPYGPANVDMSANVGSELWSNFGEASDDYVSFAAYEADETFSSVTVTGPAWDTAYVGGIAFTASGGGGGVTSTLAATEGADTASFAGKVLVEGALSATEGADTASFSSGAETAPQRNTLLLAFGQSNNISTGTTAANMATDGTSTPAEITAITATGKVKSGYPVDATFTVTDYDPDDSEPDYSVHTWGPEAGFAAAWLEEQTHPDSRLMIIKRSADSSNLGQWLPGQEAWIWVEWLIDGALAWAASNSITWDDLVVLMVNCESEGTNETLADACESRLTTLCADLRDADNLGASAKIVMTRLPDVSASYAYLSTVRTAQEAVAAASADNYLIDTDDLLPLRDAYHWMAPDVAEIGARAYAAALGEAEAEPVTGTLAATEGADSASFAGNVAVHGALDASEGADTAALEGTVLVSGAVAASEGADTATFAGAVIVAGSLAASEEPDTVAVAGTVLIQGSLAATEASDTAAFSGSQVLTGTLAATEASDSASFSGKVVVAGALAASEEVDSASFAGTVRIGGTLGATESADGAAFGGLVLIQGGLSATEGADTAAFTSRTQRVATVARPVSFRQRAQVRPAQRNAMRPRAVGRW